ncbi:hypothetical protein HPB51_012532 [Rhipicephalus microplus]|uniref:Nlr family card domain protein n=1 Tax=Rhipicephalus microplus TaxID=6941 RepID=A0A9J6DGK7_RHIMP|nr:hypothetical protein HPB51_012532 [Rhipicephalus microplus]
MNNEPESARQDGVPLKVQKLRSTPLLTLPCTRSEEKPICILLHRLAAYNEILWYAGLELREEKGHALGELTLGVAVDSQIARRPAAMDSEVVTVSLLASLLSLHRCIVAVEINAAIAKRPFLLNWVPFGRGVRSLSIRGKLHQEENVINAIVNVLNPLDEHIPLLEEYRNYSVWRPALAVYPRPNDRPKLAALDVAALELSGLRAKQFINLLRDNTTITELTIGACAFTFGCIDMSDGFGKYLTQEGSVLKKLTIRTSDVNKGALQALAKAIACMTSLEELVLDVELYNVYEKSFFAEIVARNKTLRSMSIIWPRSCVVTSIVEHPVGEAGRRIQPWLLALPENTVLSSLTIDLLGFTEYECLAFFEALTRNTTLRKVTVSHLPAKSYLREICRMIRESSMAGKVHIQDIHVSFDNLAVLPDCPEVTMVTISSVHLIERDHIYSAFSDVLVECRTLTALHVCVHSYFFDHAIHLSMASYVNGATTLRSFELQIYVDRTERELEDRQTFEGPMCPLAHALLAHPHLIKITLMELRVNERDAWSLAEATLGSRALTEMTFAALGSRANEAFLRVAMSRIESNYRLLRLSLPACRDRDAELVFIRDVTRRNSSLVTRAARFVAGEEDAYCARGIEMMAGHSSLPQLVCEMANVEAGEAMAMIRRALNLPCLTSLNGFMKMAGVVQYRVECFGLRGRTLEHLNEDCWLQIRKYLKIADIVPCRR